MANVISKLYVEFAADTKQFAAAMQDVSRQVREVEKVVKPIKDRAADAGRALTAGLSIPLAALGAAALTSAIQINEGMNAIRSQTGKTGAALTGLGKDFRAALAEVPNSISDVSKTIGELYSRTGLTGKSLQALAVEELNLARVTKTNVSENIAATTRLFGDWSVATIDQAESLNYLFKASQQTGIQFTRLTELVVQFGAPLRALGFNLEQGAALLGKWEKEGVNLETVLAGMRFALSNFAKAHVDPQKALQAIIEKIKNAKSASDATAIAFSVFGKRAAVDMSRAIIEGRFNIDGLVSSIKNSHESINQAAADTLSFSEKLKLLKNQVALALEPIGVKLIDALTRMLPAAKSALNIIADLADHFSKLSPAAQNASLGILAFAAGIGPALTIITKVSSTVIGLVALLGKAGISITGFTSALAGVGLLTAVKSYGDLSAAISLIGGTSLAATAGLVGLAGAIGIAIGSFVNWLLKVTGLQEGFDKLLKTVVDWVPVVGKWATGANAAADATASAATTTKKTVEEFAKYNIVVDTARLGDAAYLRQLTASVVQREKSTAATKAGTAATGAAKDATKGLGDATAGLGKFLDNLDKEGESAAKKLEKLREALEKASRPADFLNEELNKYRKMGATNTELARGFADEIVKAADAQTLHGIAVKGVVAELLKEATAFTKVEDAAKFLKKFREDFATRAPLPVIEQFDIPDQLRENLKTKTISAINEQRTAVYQLNDALSQMKYLAPEEAVRLFGDQLKAAAQFARIYGEDSLSPTTQRLIAFMERTEDAKDAQEKFNTASDKGVEALATMRENVTTSIEAIKRMQAAGASTKQIVTILGTDLNALGENAKLLGIKLDDPTKALIRLSEEATRQNELSRKLKDAWSTAVGNITSKFADGVTEMIFSGKKFSVSIKNIFVDLGKSLVKILVTDTFTQITKGFTKALLGLGGSGGGNKGLLGGVIGSLGGKVAKLLGIGGGAAAAGAGAGAGAGAAGAGAGAAGAGSTAGATGLFGLSAGATAGIAAAAIAAGLVIKHFVGRGRRTANEFVQEVQNPFGQNLSNIVDAFDAAKKTGTLTLDQAKEYKAALTELWSSFTSTANTFAQQGKNEAKVVGQAFSSLAEYFGPNLAKVFSGFDSTIAALTKASNVPGVGAGIPQTGRAVSASETFATAVEKFEAAVNKMPAGAAAAATTNVTVQYEDRRELNFYGLSESLINEMRDTIEPALIRDYENNTRGITEALIAAIAKMQGGVISTVPATS